uniref:Uncharacterized protein n=1 Tax=Physcomitrium patens TaxID=3218 RepID=A0A7I4BNG6_PHYPA
MYSQQTFSGYRIWVIGIGLSFIRLKRGNVDTSGKADLTAHATAVYASQGFTANQLLPIVSMINPSEDVYMHPNYFFGVVENLLHSCDPFRRTVTYYDVHTYCTVVVDHGTLHVDIGSDFIIITSFTCHHIGTWLLIDLCNTAHCRASAAPPPGSYNQWVNEGPNPVHVLISFRSAQLCMTGSCHQISFRTPLISFDHGDGVIRGYFRNAANSDSNEFRSEESEGGGPACALIIRSLDHRPLEFAPTMAAGFIAYSHFRWSSIESFDSTPRNNTKEKKNRQAHCIPSSIQWKAMCSSLRSRRRAHSDKFKCHLITSMKKPVEYPRIDQIDQHSDIQRTGTLVSLSSCTPPISLAPERELEDKRCAACPSGTKKQEGQMPARQMDNNAITRNWVWN